MKAVIVKQPGGPEQLAVQEVADPQPAAGEVLVRVHATALNRADLLQRQGGYPPPPGASPILGLELAGEVVGGDTDSHPIGTRVMALVGGGGYAELASVPGGQLMPIPDHLSYAEAAAIPEAFLTAYRNLFDLGRLEAGQRVLIHAGGSGVGSAAIQLAKLEGAEVFSTASASKLGRVRDLGADAVIDYAAEPFDQRVLQATGGAGVDLILDFIGAPYWDMNLNALKKGGRLLLIGQLGGRKVEANLGLLLTKHLTVIGSTIRSLDPATKADLAQRFAGFALLRFASGQLRPVLDRSFALDEVADAHRYMESGANFGKIVLTLLPRTQPPPRRRIGASWIVAA